MPQLGILKENRANLDASWNHRGDKFCVASTSGFFYIGTYFAENNFWVGHPVQKKPSHKASVVCARFDPASSRVVATCSMDGTCQITSCYNEDLDKDSSGPFGNVTGYGDTLFQVTSNGWVNQLSFSPTGNTLCYITHDCELNFADVSKCGDGK